MAEKASEYEELKAEFAQLKADVNKILATLGRTAEGRAQHVADDVRAKAEHARLEGERLANAAGDVMRERPVASILVSFVAGVLLAKLLDR